MDTPSESRGMPVTHIAAILVALVVLGLLGLKITSNKQQEEVEAFVVQPGALPFAEASMAEGLEGAMALLNDYAIGNTGLDQLVADRIYAPRLRHASQYAGPVQFNLASNFMMQINGYRTSTELQSFGQTAKTIAMTKPSTNSQQVFEQFARIPGGQLVLQSRGNPEMLMEFTRLTMARTEQTLSRETIMQMTAAYHTDWSLPPAPDGPIELPAASAMIDGDGFKQALAHRLRQWELNGVRYLFCLSGSPKFSEKVRAMFAAAIKPLYEHAMNATLDPVKRRFRTVAGLSPINGQEMRADGSYNTVLVPSTNGTVSLVEFTGALPRAKLYADWLVDTNDASAHQLLFSPGFDPQSRVVLQGDPGQPEQPARTGDLPALTVVESGRSIAIEIPPIRFGTVLLLNDPFEPDRGAQVDDASVPLMRANVAMTALFLPAAEKERTITIGEASGFSGLGKFLFGALAVIVIALIIARRRD